MALMVAMVFGLTAALEFADASMATPGISPLGNCFVAAFSLAMAVMFLRVRAYRPDLDKRDKQRLKLGWWTGTPKDSH